MDRIEQVKRHNKNIKEAFEYAKKGGVINLTALICGHEQVIIDDVEGKAERVEKMESDNWKV